uniref:plasmodesmata-located protein 2-like n=1 Tax=Erigeron canadensis TaxID=72917 RepID=UPI001CB9B5F6|nr:plasmodesmata-located protein 2-like [Erigeron canadensis]
MKPSNLVPLILIIGVVVNGGGDNNKLVYKGCAKQGLSDPNGVYSSALSAIFGTLIQQSSKAKFFKTTSGSVVSGLFQCRGDLSNVECYTCVSRLPILMDKLCGKTVAARIQLLGCYMLYEVSGFAQISGMELLYKKCGKTGSGVQQTSRDAAFSSLETAIAANNNGGFYTTSYEAVYVLGQCEGDLGSSDCGACVKSAVQRAQVECGRAVVSGQIYLHRCFISFNYYAYPNGGTPPPKPNNNPSSSYSSSSSSSSSSTSSSGSNTGKTVAIILGGAAGVGFLIVFLLIVRKAMKKDDDGY